MKYIVILSVIALVLANNVIWYFVNSHQMDDQRQELMRLQSEFQEYRKYAPGPVSEIDISFDAIKLEIDMRDAKTDEMRVMIAKRYLNEALSNRELLSESTLYAHTEMVNNGWKLWRLEKPSGNSVILRRKEIAFLVPDLTILGAASDVFNHERILYVKADGNGKPAMVKGKTSDVIISNLGWQVLK